MTPKPPSPPADSSEHLSRTELRRLFKARRATLSNDQRVIASRRIADHLCSQDLFSKTAAVAAFEATATEVDLSSWIARHLNGGGRVMLPRVGDKGGAMEFHAYTMDTPLQPNRFGIGEPPAASPLAAPSDIDTVLVPLVAFDGLGHRLGMGGGFYDRYLPRLRPGIPLIGIGFACQQYDHLLPREAWDVPLHAVVTEHGMLKWDFPR